jgi:hypothetical protein
MKTFRILSGACMALVLALASLAVSGCSTPGDASSGASSTTTNGSSSGY